MTIKEFNTKIINQGFAQTDKHIVFQTPDGKVYTDVEIIHINQGNEVICKVKLIDKIEPKFKVGDVVTNSSGLYPNVKCTISKINYDEQYYCYKEVSGVTYFKDQDKLILANDEEVRPPVEGDTDIAIIGNNIVEDIDLYLNIEEVKTIQAKAVVAKIGSSIIESIIKDIKKAAAEGKGEIKIKYKDYNISNDKITYVCYWARTCGFIVSSYDEIMYIKW